MASDRCEVCGWPRVEDWRQGCVPGNCSQRPQPRVSPKVGQVADLERRLAEAEAKLADLRDWAKVANQFAWAHERSCKRHDADAPCNCGLDQFLSRPRVVVESYRQQLAAVEHELQEERAKRRADVQDLLGAIGKFSEQAQP